MLIGADYDTELKSTGKEKTCELPDGNVIFVVADRFGVLFQSHFTGEQASGVHDTSSRVDICLELYVNVVLSGGTTMFHLFFENTTMEVKWLLYQSKYFFDFEGS